MEHGETKPTGQFNYTFEVKKDVKIVPQSYTQFMIWLDARRRAIDVVKSLEDADIVPSEAGGKGGVME